MASCCGSACRGIVDDPASLGMLLALVYVAGALAQVAVGSLLDRVPVKLLYAVIVALQVPLFLFAAGASGWVLYALMIAFMIAVFGAIPFTDALIVRYVDDSCARASPACGSPSLSA